MACLCGDLCCPSCGPAQGNTRCLICRAWASDGGCEFPERCQARMEELIDAEPADDVEDCDGPPDGWDDPDREPGTPTDLF